MVAQSIVKWRACLAMAFTVAAGLGALIGLLSSVPNSCNMTYMYPTYIPLHIDTNINVSSSAASKYGLFLYHEGWKKIDFDEHLAQLSGVPVLFIPGNGGSYKQVRSLGAESDRAFQNGPLDNMYFQEASFTVEEAGISSSSNKRDIKDKYWELKNLFSDIRSPSHYINRLDWFAVDLEGEQSAMDGRILEEHTDYVVRAIHKVLDHYSDVYSLRSKGNKENIGILPKTVILVGHSMGGFVARAAVVHPNLRKGAVETIVTLSSPHRAPPVALQPSLGHFFSQVNQAWKNGYKVQRTKSGRLISDSSLKKIVVVSISGGIRDYQVRSNLASLDGIVPATHGMTIVATGMRDVWLSMEHQSILWCNQLVVQLSHALLHLIEPNTGQSFSSRQKRLAIFISQLRSGIPQSFGLMDSLEQRHNDRSFFEDKDNSDTGTLKMIKHQYSCPSTIKWAEDSRERDLFIDTRTVTVLAMDGRRRWMDIKKQALDGKDNFVLVTNLLPCVGIRVHLWPEKGKLSLNNNTPAMKKVIEVTSKMVHIPSGPAPRQIEPGSQTEQAPPSAILRLGPDELHGYRFLTISIAPRPSISGRPPPATSMAVGHFYNPSEGKTSFSPGALLFSSYRAQDILLQENHPLIFNLSFSISMGILPVSLTLKTQSCGIKDSLLTNEQIDDEEGHNSLCKLRCFPPVALVWDLETGISIFPNLYSDTIMVDSSPALWGSRPESGKTTLLLLVDPHCSYKVSASVSLIAAASRFLLLHSSQIIGFTMAIFFFTLMQQARAWELDLPLPSVQSIIESNLRSPLSVLFLFAGPLAVYMFLAALETEPYPPFGSFLFVCFLCYAFANGTVVILTWITELVFYVVASVHVFLKQRYQAWESSLPIHLTSVLLARLAVVWRFPMLRILWGKPTLAIAIIATLLVCFVHPAIGLFVLLIHHAWCCHIALCSFLTATFRSHPIVKGDQQNLKSKDNVIPEATDIGIAYYKTEESHSPSKNSTICFSDAQLEAFCYQQNLLLLHMTATIMLVPSLVAWGQRLGMDHSVPWFLDSALSIGIIVHGVCSSKLNHNIQLFPVPVFGNCGLSVIYCLAGFYCYFAGLNMAPYRAFYALTTVGLLSVLFKILERRYRERGGIHLKRRHSHRH